MGRFETEVLTDSEHVDALTDLSGKWIDRVRERKPIRELILDLDSSVSETYGSQEGTAYDRTKRNERKGNVPEYCSCLVSIRFMFSRIQ